MKNFVPGANKEFGIIGVLKTTTESKQSCGDNMAEQICQEQWAKGERASKKETEQIFIWHYGKENITQ